jgi:hypothetical protein
MSPRDVAAYLSTSLSELTVPRSSNRVRFGPKAAEPFLLHHDMSVLTMPWSPNRLRFRAKPAESFPSNSNSLFLLPFRISSRTGSCGKKALIDVSSSILTGLSSPLPLIPPIEVARLGTALLLLALRLMSWRARRRVVVTAAADGTSNFILDRGLVDIIGRPKWKKLVPKI